MGSLPTPNLPPVHFGFVSGTDLLKLLPFFKETTESSQEQEASPFS